MSVRHRLSKLLLRQGIVYSGGKAWTSTHDLWLRRQHFDQSALQHAFNAAYDAAIAAMAADSEFTAVVDRLGCLRGISTLTGFGLAVEIGDWHRLDGRRIGAYLGMVPTEHSSGASRNLGGITKTGNTHARRLLIEAAWHHRHPYRSSSPTMRARWDKAPAAARRRGDEGNRRLNARWVAFDARNKRSVVANAAIARELASWCWSLAVME
ncbi:transposase [Pseudarthrobacter sp. H3Y2-7]|uniref:transposase n=1 Tax=Pseudarthrobacter naphthalenicus TaxID=3031328 RepID=UPI0023AFEF46|nr:transposase [Pseudarthrobacter sp. H3Y2-7]